MTPNAELGITVTAVVALVAGLVRGFTGFGGPALMLAVLTIFYSPISILGKILVVDFVASGYMFRQCFKEINWRETAAIAIPTMLTMPLGQWLLHEIDPVMMRRAIGLIIALTCLLMLLGFRYQKSLSVLGMTILGLCSGVVFGATYIALVVVTVVLLGPYDRFAARTLIVSWAFVVSVWYAIISIISGATVIGDVWIAAPGAVLYLAGVYIGSLFFQKAQERRYRNLALMTLLLLSFISLLG